MEKEKGRLFSDTDIVNSTIEDLEYKIKHYHEEVLVIQAKIEVLDVLLGHMRIKRAATVD